jgi:quinol monooxygenase YgiN
MENPLRPPVTALPLDPHDGPVLIAVEYRIDPVRVGEFLHVMQERRSSCLRRGVLSWSLFRDTSDPSLYVEQFVNESWAEHLRHFDRMTVFDLELRERRLGFHVEQSPPKVTRYVAQGLGS